MCKEQVTEDFFARIYLKKKARQLKGFNASKHTLTVVYRPLTERVLTSILVWELLS